MRLYQRLYEIGQNLNKILDLSEIFQAAARFALYDLNFERCLLLRQEGRTFSVVVTEGYYDQAQEQQVKALTFAVDTEPVLWPLLGGADSVIALPDCDQPDLVDLRQRIGMDEYVIYSLAPGTDNVPAGLLIAGNTIGLADYHSRIDPKTNQMLGLANLINQVTTSVTITSLYQTVESMSAPISSAMSRSVP